MGVVPAEASRGDRLSTARAALKGAEERLSTTRLAWDAPTLPLAAGLTPALPEGLRRGQVVAVTGSTSLMLALVGEASKAGSWTSIVGMPHVGIVAAAGRGVDLTRLALVPHPGIHAAAVVAACIGGMDVVMLGPRLAMSDADRRRIAAKAREGGSVLIVAGPWPGAHAVLEVKGARWVGLGAGDGRLRGRELTVAVEGRARGAVRTVTLAMDVDPQWRGSRRGVVPAGAAAKAGAGESSTRPARGAT